MSKPEYQCYVYDFTIKQSCDHPDWQSVKRKWMDNWCKKWVFQLERGDGGYKHWQGRVSLIKPRRCSTLVNKWCVGGHISVTSKEVATSKNFDYTMKSDTRIEGPWSDADPEPPRLTRQLKEFLNMELRPWQKTIKDMSQEYNGRSVNLIIDKVGNIGKSIFCEYLRYMKLGRPIPPLRSMEDIMALCMCLPESKCYLIDMPRGMKKDKLGEFYSGVETLKNGYMYDKRYAFKERYIDRPQIFIFTNAEPAYDLLSKDRWEIFEVSKNFELQKKYF